MSEGFDANACEVVAVPLGAMTIPPREFREPRTKAVPDTSSVPAGLVVPIPTLPPDSKMAEFSRLQALVNLAIWLAVAVPSLVRDEQADGGVSNGNASEPPFRFCDPRCEPAEPTGVPDAGWTDKY